jgi:hypothetical protein
MKFGSIAIAKISEPRRLPGPPPANCSRSATRANVVGEGIGLQVAEAACDDIHLYRGDREALTSSLDHIQHAASQILRAIEAGGQGWSSLWKAWPELLHDAADSG